MACSDCDGRPAMNLETYPAGNPRASLIAAQAARLDREISGADSHVHYQVRGDVFVIVRPIVAEVTA
ncbi:hypothetical protein OS965_32840 [Streptomyces sp. H27-G5]|uniref:hypothetical protein n=1 Tax=Streptomyces sp. H27-G5 TaxID=2996698 RepID=UPI0022707D1B|nr:hypothetical protein [Streptomyces sp. H27-G5]MCY0922877.1 hypothetical protein [Streptomyces sp. H27-G5]